ncbi:taste receptor type 1 member 2-like [Parambassis ranga]|uniref:Taste receptor type 1 member 2-like n=1 Tax=Parambassis ranga TaxID=210632 RepID=A0A6P7IMN6_9TELE|nr:taste receptor type 1 member 2-like [Parambassis ranga]
MKQVVAFLCLLGSFQHAVARCTVPASEFQLEGDYFIGGLFDIHQVGGPKRHDRPEAIDCSRQPLILSSYRRFQLMRFSVEEINNSTDLLPDVSLGYEMIDHCSDIENIPGALNLISVNNSIQPWVKPHKNVSKVIAVVGTYTSTETLTVAPLFMTDLIPMVTYGAASSVFSEKQNFPSLLRTVLSSRDVVEVIIAILQQFSWHWVGFLYSDNDYGKDGLQLFTDKIKNTEICLAYTIGLSHDTNYSSVFKQLMAQKVGVIAVFAPEWHAEDLIRSAIQLNVTKKVWIAGDAWSLNKRLPKEKGIQNIGTVLGVSEPKMEIPGFNDFLFSVKHLAHCENAELQMFCNQICNCSGLSAEDAIAADPSFSFPVYSAVYSIAHALHSAMQCKAGGCNGNITVYPHMVLSELKKLDFTLLNQNIQFDKNGDCMFGSYSIVFWNHRGAAQEVGFYRFHPSLEFFINVTDIQWYTKGEVPTSLCSPECPVGYKKKQDGLHKCCFICEICPHGAYINSTKDPYSCIYCKDTEWSEEGSTSCSVRTVEYLSFTDVEAVAIMFGNGAFVCLTTVVCVLFAINYNTPVVRSAGGPMCFLILGCLSLCSVSVFFYFGTPTVTSCILRSLPFLLFYTVCLACFVVRAFQIVCIFKMAAKFPKFHSWWMKYQGQWLIISAAFFTQVFLIFFGFYFAPPVPYNETVWYPDKIILSCDINLHTFWGCMIFPLILCSLCFIFSYMGKDLPKNYNEAKAITYCLFLLICTWIVFATVRILYRGKYIQVLSALAVLSSLYSFLLWYFFPKCSIIIFQPHKNTQQHFQGLIQSYTKTISQ